MTGLEGELKDVKVGDHITLYSKIDLRNGRGLTDRVVLIVAGFVIKRSSSNVKLSQVYPNSEIRGHRLHQLGYSVGGLFGSADRTYRLCEFTHYKIDPPPHPQLLQP